MPNLAAFRYRAVMAAAGGPVARIELGDFTVAGARRFAANAYLCAELCGPRRSENHLFSDATGSGTDAAPMVARFKAISETLERWAHLTLAPISEGRRYGFDIDPSTTGMAAYPGLFAREARRAALHEAAERFNLRAWWEGHLAARETTTPWPGVEAAVLCSEAPGITVLLHRRAPDGSAAYGHASAATYAAACARAMDELERHALVLRQRVLASNDADTVLPEVTDLLERRSLHFASAHGYEHFLERLRSGCSRPALRPRLICDAAIPGPWSRYASVWRVAYAPPSERFLADDPTYFFW